LIELCNGLFGLTQNGNEAFGLTSGRDMFSRGIEQRGALFEFNRRSVVQALEKQPGRHLVLLRYTPGHNPHEEWVFNGADIDAGKIVWAREMSPEQDRPFLDYFRNRRVWLLEPDQSPPKLSPYPRGVASP